MNPLNLFKQNKGIFLLETKLFLGSGSIKHFAVYVCEEWSISGNPIEGTRSRSGFGVIKDNQEDVSFFGIEASDRAGKKQAIRAFTKTWPKVSQAFLKNAHILEPA